MAIETRVTMAALPMTPERMAAITAGLERLAYCVPLAPPETGYINREVATRIRYARAVLDGAANPEAVALAALADAAPLANPWDEVARLRIALAEATATARTDEREACARLVEVYSEGIAQFIRDRALDERAGSPATTGGTTDAE
jgi:hypothetical protein